MSGRSQLVSPAEAMQGAAAAYGARDWARAEQLCRLILAGSTDHFEALNLLGIIKAQTLHLEEAVPLLRRAVAVRPDSATAHNNYANVLRDLQRFRDALDHYDRALALEPHYAEAYNNRGGALRALGRLDAALESYDRSIALRGDNAEAHYNRGVTLHDAGRFVEALDSYARAVLLHPGFAEAYYNQGIALQELRRLDEALRSYDCALQIAASAAAYNNRGTVLLELGRHDEALHSYDQALQLNPALADAYNNRGNALRELKRPAEALHSYERALKINPDLSWLFGAWLHTKLQLCDWADIESAVTELTSRIMQGRRATRPFTVLAVTDALAVQRRAAEISSQESELLSGALPPPVKRAAREIIRVAYYSSDFHNHATAQLMAGLFELHDRQRFEIAAFSFGTHQRDQMTERLQQAFDRFVDVRARSDREVAQLSRDFEIDIAVDLKGFTQDSRPGIFAHRAAPIQVNFLGYPGTTGARCIDYIVADPTVIPRHTRHYYSENVIYLPNSYYPNSYQINDRKEPLGDGLPSRAQLGLPQAGFIFCCFNSTYKIVPGTFRCWIRLLKAVAGSVLWLLSDNSTAAANLRTEAERLGVSGARVIFAPPLPLAQHLPRYRAADLFLDTLPCGAHTTASDALWTGLPVVTLAGEAFAARVAASLLNAIGLPELVASTAEQYEAVALALATDPQRMATIRSRLNANRLTTPLFDTRLLTSHLENGYAQIYRRYHAGLSPDDVLVPADLSQAPA